MIFAAGFGKRLQPLTLKTPKALITIKNKPMLDWVVENLVQHGISEIILNTHYLHSKIHSYLQLNHFLYRLRFHMKKPFLALAVDYTKPVTSGIIPIFSSAMWIFYATLICRNFSNSMQVTMLS